MATRQRVDLTIEWVRPLLPILIGIACVGCVASLVLHTLAVFADPTWGIFSFLSVPVLFLVWFPTVCEALRLNRGPSGTPMFGMAYSRGFRGVPRPVRVAAWCVVAYVVVTTVWALIVGRGSGGRGPSGEGVPLGLSLAPLAFYLFAALTVISAMRTPPEDDVESA